MSTEHLTLIAFARDTSLLRDRTTIERFLASLAGFGYHLAATSEQVDMLWEAALASSPQAIPFGRPATARSAAKTDIQALFVPGPSEVLKAAIAAFALGQHDELEAVAFSTAHAGLRRGVTFRISVSLVEGSVALSPVAPGYQQDDGMVLHKHWLKLAQVAYQVWHPFYAYEFSGGYEPVLTRDEVLAGNIHWLYGLNFFGPELVEQVGRERLLHTPALQVLPLDDGGIMLLTRLYELLPPTHRRQGAAARYLGFSSFDDATYHEQISSPGYSGEPDRRWEKWMEEEIARDDTDLLDADR